MDRIAKFLKKLERSELETVQHSIEKLLSGNTNELDIKKLKGFDTVYRVRAGTIRIIYHRENGKVRLIEISRRSEGTYKNF